MGRVISTALQFIDSFTNPSRTAIKSLQNMGREVQRTAKQIQDTGKAISGVGAAITAAVTMPIVGVATAAVKTAADFDNAMAKVSTIANESAVPISALREQVINLSNAVGVGVADIAEAQYQAISAGVDTAASVDFVSVAVKAAKGGFTDTTTAVDGLTTVLNAYGFEAGKAAQISDQMLLAQNFGKTSFGDMASSMGKVIPIASSLNVSTEELFGSIAVLTKNGIATSEAVTGLKAAYSNVLKPSADAGKTAQQLGLNFSAAHLQSVGWAKFLDEIKEKTGGNTETMAKLFGSTEALNSVTVLAGKGSADFAKVLKDMGGAAGMTEKAYKKMITPTERMTIAFNKIKNASINFGAALMPVVEKAAAVIDMVGDRLNSLSGAQVDNIIKWAGMAAAVGPAIAVFGKIVTAVGTVQRVFGTAIRIVGNFGGIMGVITSPAAIVIGVLAAVAGAAFLIVKNWDRVKASLQGSGGWFQGALAEAKAAVQDFKDVFKTISDALRPVFEAGAAGAKAMLAGLVRDVGPIVSGFVTAFRGVGGMLKGIFGGDTEAALKGFRTFSGGLLDAIGGILKAKINAIKNFTVGALSSFLPAGTVERIAGAFDMVASAWDVAVAAAKGYVEGFVQAVKPLIEDVKTVFGGLCQFVRGLASGDWKGALDGLKTAAGGALSGLVNVTLGPFRLVKGAVEDAVRAFRGMGIVKNICDAAGNAILRMMKGCGVDMGKFAENVRNIKARVNSVMNGMRTAFDTVFGAVGRAVRPVAVTIARLLGKDVGDSCSTAGAVLAALKAVAGAAFGFIATAAKLRLGFLVAQVRVAFNMALGFISAAVHNITAVVGGVMTVFDGITTFISGVFTGNWRQAWEGVKTIFKGVFDSFAALCKTPLNAVIGIINGAVSGINKLGFTVPDWVPVIGGKPFTINVPTIPMLYKGTKNWQGGAAVINDRGGEIVDLPRGSRVYPHDRSVEMARSEGAASSPGIVQVTINKLADRIEVRSDDDIDRIAEALAYKLKKVALNTGAT